MPDQDLAAEVHALRLSVGEMRDVILARIESAYVRQDTHALEVRNLNNQIQVLATEVGSLKAARNWVIGIVLGAVLVALVTLVVHPVHV